MNKIDRFVFDKKIVLGEKYFRINVIPVSGVIFALGKSLIAVILKKNIYLKISKQRDFITSTRRTL